MRTSIQKKFSKKIAAAISLTAVSLTSIAFAEGLPKSMVWTSHGATSSGYAQTVAIGNVLKNTFGTTLRVLPGKNDLSRITPLKMGTAGYCACGIASYFAQEGVLQFATKSWGPQPLRVILTSKGSFGLGLAIAKDIAVEELSDLKGSRVAWIRDSDALNRATTAFLAYGGLTWDDVSKVEFPGFKESIDGLINGQIDTAFASTVSPHLKRLAASPRGLTWSTLPLSNRAAWIRLNYVAPYFTPVAATDGVEISKSKPWIGAGYPYPILVTSARQSAGDVYTLTKAMVETFDDYKDKAPGAEGWNIDNQNFEWILPYHDGSVKYFKEIGKWSEAAQKHQDMLLERQNVLTAAYTAYTATNPSKDEFKAGWSIARMDALAEANLTVNFN